MGRPDVDPLEYEIQESRAIALGDAGRKLEKALAALAARPDSDVLIDQAANATWELFIIRESLGFYGHDLAVEAYAVPNRVLARVGVVRKH